MILSDLTKKAGCSQFLDGRPPRITWELAGTDAGDLLGDILLVSSGGRNFGAWSRVGRQEALYGKDVKANVAQGPLQRGDCINMEFEGSSGLTFRGEACG